MAIQNSCTAKQYTVFINYKNIFTPHSQNILINKSELHVASHTIKVNLNRLLLL